MRDLRTLVTGCLIAALTFAGCVGGEATDADAAGAGSATLDAGNGANPADIGPAGTIQGTVRTDELVPIVGASVGLLKSQFPQVETDDSGAFAFVNLPIGEYSIIAQKLGYESKAQKIKVEESQTVWVNLTLTSLAVADEMYYETTIHTAKLQCMLKAVVWVSSCSYPYTAVYLSAKNNGVNLSNYGAPPDIMDNKWRYNFSIAPGNVMVVSELLWTAQSDLAKILWMRHCKDDYDPVWDDCTQLAGKTGPSPIVNHWEVPKGHQPKSGVNWVMSAVWPTFDTSAGVFLDQKIEMFNSVFYGAPPAEDWSITAEAAG